MLTDHSYGVVPIRYRSGVREFLLVQHKHGAHWAFPKGHAEAGETPIQSAKRELVEETGLIHVALRASPAFEESYYSIKKGVTYDKTVTYYMGDVLIDEKVVVQAAEVSDYAWLPFEKAVKRITYPASQELLLEVQAFLTGV